MDQPVVDENGMAGRHFERLGALRRTMKRRVFLADGAAEPAEKSEPMRSHDRFHTAVRAGCGIKGDP